MSDVMLQNQAATWRSQTEETSTADCGSPKSHRPWKSQLSQTMEVLAVTDRGNTSCHRPKDIRVEHPNSAN